MTIAYWCVLAVIVMPYFWVMIARIPSLTLQTNLIPRQVAEGYSGVQQRFYWAHLNALEAIAPFAAVVIIAHQLNATQATIDMLALMFVGFRVSHAMAYAANLGVIRSLIFFAGSVCMISILLSAI